MGYQSGPSVMEQMDTTLRLADMMDARRLARQQEQRLAAEEAREAEKYRIAMKERQAAQKLGQEALKQWVAPQYRTETETIYQPTPTPETPSQIIKPQGYDLNAPAPTRSTGVQAPMLQMAPPPPLTEEEQLPEVLDGVGKTPGFIGIQPPSSQLEMPVQPDRAITREKQVELQKDIPELYQWMGRDQYEQFLRRSAISPELGEKFLENAVNIYYRTKEKEEKMTDKQRQRIEWERISAMPDGPEKDKAIDNFLMWVAPSSATTQTGIKGAVAKATAVEKATAPIKISTAAATEYAKTQAGMRSSIDFVEKNGLKGIDPATGKPYTQDQITSSIYGHRMENANKIVDDLAGEGFDETKLENWFLSNIGDKGTVVGDLFRKIGSIADQRVRSYAQAKLDYVIGFLRKTSGAAINKDEYINTSRQFFAAPGDDVNVLEQKRNARLQATSDVISGAGNAYDETSKRMTEYLSQQKPSPYKPPAIKGALGTKSNPQKPASQADYDKYPSGAYYIDDDGQLKIKR